MHRPGVCNRCKKFNEGFFKFTDKGCDCTDQQLVKFNEEQMESLERSFNNRSPSISECKQILLANGYIVKKNKKLKRRR